MTTASKEGANQLANALMGANGGQTAAAALVSPLDRQPWPNGAV